MYSFTNLFIEIYIYLDNNLFIYSYYVFFHLFIYFLFVYLFNYLSIYVFGQLN